MSCKHYIRFVEFICKECLKNKKQEKKSWSCRFCHNENCLHTLDRHNIDQMKCLFCYCIQPKSNVCINPECYKKKHNYYCEKCSLWTHSLDKFFHCDKCNICRVGDKDMFKHCDKCNLCWKKSSFDIHNCKFNQSSNNCPICMESVWDYKDNVCVLECGHSFHTDCINQYLESNYNCPICKKSIYNMNSQWQAFDQLVKNSPIPDEYQDWRISILCNDCLNNSTINFNLLGLFKCLECGSYNTQQDKLYK